MTVFIVGSGLAALMAAARLTGLFSPVSNIPDIYILSAGNGSSPYVHGFNVPAITDDSAEIFFRDTMESSEGISDPVLVKILCEESLRIPKLLKKIGINLLKDGNNYSALRALGSSYPRVVSSSNHTGVDILKNIHGYLKNNSAVHFLDHTRALDLDVENNSVKGIYFYDLKKNKYFYARADSVLIAAGGYSGIYPFSTNSEDIGGDGIAMAYRAGAKLRDMEFIQFEPCTAIWPPKLKGKSIITTMFYEGAALTNNKHSRFLSKQFNGLPGECVNKDVLSKEIWSEIQKGNASPHGGIYFDATGVKKEILENKYYSYVERYKSAGIDIEKELFEIIPAPHTSLGGICIDSYCRTNVNGLYAAGEAVGGIHGANRIGGNAGLEILVFGYRAGEEILKEGTAKKYISNTEFREIFAANNNNFPVSGLRKEMQDYLQKDVYVVRDEGGTKEAVNGLSSLLSVLASFSTNECGLEAFRLKNDLTAAYLTAVSANKRRQSKGCHERRDSIEEPEAYHFELQKKNNELTINKIITGGMYEKGNC